MIPSCFFMYVLSSLPFLCSAMYDNNISMPNCRESFSFPTAFEPPINLHDPNAGDTDCGSMKLDCTLNHEKIQFGKGSSSETIAGKHGIYPQMRVTVLNTTFEKLLENKSCEALENNFTSPAPLLFSILIENSMVLFKCKNVFSSAEPIGHVHFNPSDYNSLSCSKDHKFYYNHNISNTTVPCDLPDTCEVIRLPVKKQREYCHESETIDIFCLLTHEFSIFFNLSNSCEDCLRKEGQCHTDNGVFKCILDAKKENHGRVVLILVLVAGFVLILMLSCAIFVIWRYHKSSPFTKAKHDVINVENFLKNHDFLAPKRYSYSQVKKMTNSFEVKLGQGGFGSVYRGSLSNGTLVAVKVLSELKGKGGDFINEVASVGRTSHVNIVSLLGFCLDVRQKALIYEFMPNGSLEKFIYGRGSSSNSDLGWGKLQQIAIGIARGLEYLHSGCNTRILHFDIKPHNILLDKNLCPKISDFGLAKLFPSERSKVSMSCMRGTPGYIAPELVSRNLGQVSHKSDVYSYGMMILEMVGGRKNIEVEVDHTSEIYFPHWIYKKVELHEEKLELHGIVSDEENEMARKMIIVGLWCIQTNPLSRPTMTKVLEMLEGDLELLEIPPKPYLSSPPRLVDSSSTC